MYFDLFTIAITNPPSKRGDYVKRGHRRLRDMFISERIPAAKRFENYRTGKYLIVKVVDKSIENLIRYIAHSNILDKH